MNLHFSRRATQRLREISDYIHTHNPAAARSVRQAIHDACVLVSDHPMAGLALRPGVRRFVVPRLPYLVYYQVDDAAGTVTIITIRHAARRPLS